MQYVPTATCSLLNSMGGWVGSGSAPSPLYAHPKDNLSWIKLRPLPKLKECGMMGAKRSDRNPSPKRR